MKADIVELRWFVMTSTVYIYSVSSAIVITRDRRYFRLARKLSIVRISRFVRIATVFLGRYRLLPGNSGYWVAGVN